MRRDFAGKVPTGLAACLTAMGLLVMAPAQAADAAVRALKVENGSFRCIRQMTPVRHFYVDNLLGHTNATVAAANSATGAIYPEGSVVQLVPTEVMVKHEKGFNPATGDWEFFELEVSENGSRIRTRGFAEVNNRFGKNCFICHVPARDPWDFICESGHGCEPIPVNRAMIGALQRSDPRCGPSVLQSGDSAALWRLKAMLLIGSALGWAKSFF